MNTCRPHNGTAASTGAALADQPELGGSMAGSCCAKLQQRPRGAAAAAAAGEGEDDVVGEARVGGEEEEVVPAVAGAQGHAG